MLCVFKFYNYLRASAKNSFITLQTGFLVKIYAFLLEQTRLIEFAKNFVNEFFFTILAWIVLLFLYGNAASRYSHDIGAKTFVAPL